MEQNYSTTFENANVGDSVWSPTFGWGEITEIGMGGHPIHVLFFHNYVSNSYTVEGYLSNELPIQSLFWDVVAFVAPAKPVQ
jgi:hypothetical protein